LIPNNNLFLINMIINKQIIYLKLKNNIKDEFTETEKKYAKAV